MVTVRRLLLVLAAAFAPLVAGFVWFAENLPDGIEDATSTDAIVVLTGGSDRISTGLALLEQGKGKRLFVSGVNPKVDVPELLHVARAGGGETVSPALAARIDLGHAAGDTFGNAIETVDWMRYNNFHSMRLVTADYHMRRALIEFHLAAPDIAIVPNPVTPAATGAGRWWRDRNTFDLLLSEYGKYVIAKWRYTIARLTGQTETEPQR
jgi:uncharacterized SAM-binding protein YcdF (DUF218 family)